MEMISPISAMTATTMRDVAGASSGKESSDAVSEFRAVPILLSASSNRLVLLTGRHRRFDLHLQLVPLERVLRLAAIDEHSRRRVHARGFTKLTIIFDDICVHVAVEA